VLIDLWFRGIDTYVWIYVWKELGSKVHTVKKRKRERFVKQTKAK
jgi:hypothetical protein